MNDEEAERRMVMIYTYQHAYDYYDKLLGMSMPMIIDLISLEQEQEFELCADVKYKLHKLIKKYARMIAALTSLKVREVEELIHYAITELTKTLRDNG